MARLLPPKRQPAGLAHTLSHGFEKRNGCAGEMPENSGEWRVPGGKRRCGGGNASRSGLAVHTRRVRRRRVQATPGDPPICRWVPEQYAGVDGERQKFRDETHLAAARMRCAAAAIMVNLSDRGHPMEPLDPALLSRWLEISAQLVPRLCMVVAGAFACIRLRWVRRALRGLRTSWLVSFLPSYRAAS